MHTKQLGRALFALSALALLTSPSWAAATLNVTPGANLTADNGIVRTDAVMPTLVTGALNADFLGAFNAWNNEVGNLKGWTLVNGGALGADTIFNVSTYNAQAIGLVGRLSIIIDYTPGVGAPPTIGGNANNTLDTGEAAWSQSIATNMKLDGSLPGNPYLDNPGNGGTNPPLYPFQFLDSHFDDNPQRPAISNWTGVAYLSTRDLNTKTLTVFDGVKYGFTVVPEAGTITLTVLGGTGLLGGMLTRRRKTA